MRASVLVLAIALLASLCIGQTCPEQTWVNSIDVPFAVDPNMIQADPVTGEPALLAYLIGDVGRELVYDGYGCDPDGNAMTFAASKGAMEHPTPDTFTWRFTPVAVGVDYVQISITDQPLPHQEPFTTTGTIAIMATPQNRPPVLCGGRP